ncbi:histone-lysine N-methyltransferase SETMAR [Trichonephila clavipes]|nr:histone-lysine N-methyltransferase SETMAR [Trichonephila clavipes]
MDSGKVAWAGVLLIDDNVRSHMVMAMQNHIAILGWKYLHHQPYSSDIAPSDFYLFLALKKDLARRCFGSNAEVKQAVKRFFHMQSPEFLLERFL